MSAAAADAIPSHSSDFPCIDLVNSSFTDYLGSGTRADRLESPEWREWFLTRHRLMPSVRAAAPVAALRMLRNDLAGTLDKWSSRVTLGARDVGVLDEWIRCVAPTATSCPLGSRHRTWPGALPTGLDVGDDGRRCVGRGTHEHGRPDPPEDVLQS